MNTQSHTPSPIHFKEFVLISALLVSVTALSIDTVLPAMGLIGADLRVANPNDAQYIISTLFVGFTIGQIIYGPISDSFGRKLPIYIGLGLFICGSLLSLMSQNYELMLFGRLLQGLGVAAPRVVSISMTRDLYAGREMARVMSFVMAVFIFVPVVAPTIGQTIMLFGNWRYIFVMFIVLALILGTWIYRRLPETLSADNRRPFSLPAIWTGTKEVIGNSTTMIYTVASGLIFGALIGYLNSAQQIFEQYFHVGKLFPLYFAMSALSIGAASIVNSSIVRRYGMRFIAAWALMTMIAASLAFLIFCETTTAQVSIVIFMGYALVTFFSVGLLFGNLNAIAMEPMGHQAGIAAAVIGFASSAISVVLGTMIGQAYDGTLVPMITGFVGLSGASFILLVWEPKKHGKPIFKIA